MNTLAAIPEVSIPRHHFDTMLAFTSLMFQLKKSPAYQQWIAAHVPPSAMLGSDHDAILIGFDFHLTEDGPKLIEINNNAGGLFTGSTGWLAQPSLDGSLLSRLQQMFPDHWKTIAIVDEAIETQFMLPEMQAYAELLRQQGRTVFLASPQAITATDDGLYIDDQRLDGIYNRHTDFYLQQDAMADIRRALEANQVELNPFPRSYALLGDKDRMADWWQAGSLDPFLSEEDCALIHAMVPEVTRLQDVGDDVAWQQRKHWVFKPPSSHAGKGVVIGKNMSRTRFNSLGRDTTLMQRFIPASEISTAEGDSFRFDLRLYMHGAQLIALAGRLWRGQLTNFRQEGSGWTA
ncbi:MAG: hypothetical protein Q9M09_03995, partial [Mariprofundaceae bacterium]|nr:hypothetical protein [Mariprofundaceae bacterium]